MLACAAESGGAGSNGGGGTTNSGAWDCSRAITAGKGFGGGAEFANISAGAVTGAISVAAFGFTFAFTVGSLCVVSAGAAGSGGESGRWNDTTAGPVASVCSINADGNGKGAAGRAGAVSLGGAGASTTCRSGTSIRLSCQGKAKPGRPNSSPLKVRLNISAWINREVSNGI